MSDVKMVYEAVEEMQKLFNDCAQKAEQGKSNIQRIAQMLEGGSLLGQAGEVLAAGLRDRLSLNFDQLANKFYELSGQLGGAMQDFQTDDTKSAGYFK